MILGIPLATLAVFSPQPAHVVPHSEGKSGLPCGKTLQVMEEQLGTSHSGDTINRSNLSVSTVTFLGDVYSRTLNSVLVIPCDLDSYSHPWYYHLARQLPSLLLMHCQKCKVC